MEARSGRWGLSLLLALPLVLFSAWLVQGGIQATHGPASGPSAAPAPIPTAVPTPPPTAAPAPAPAAAIEPWAGSGLPDPSDDLPAARLEERVDGAADFLRGHGCLRLVAWRLEAPPADVELLVFGDDKGADAVFARDAGPSRDPGPGDEAAVDAQSVLFRRGVYYARLMADPDAGPEAGAGLLDAARRLDAVLRESSGGAGR